MMRWLCLSLIAAGWLFGDGGMVVPPNEEIEEFGQVAIVKFLEGREELSISTKFMSYSTDFAWVVPLPSEPVVDSVSQELFSELQHFCRPLYRRSGGFGCGFGGLSEEGPGGRYGDSLGVEEVSGGIIGDYSYQVLLAFNPDTLESYLTGHGYELPYGAAAIFNHYLEKNWNYFVVARVRDSVTRYETRNIGIRLSFDADSLVYPLYISRIGSVASDVILYVLADHRQMFPGAQLKFSGKVNQNSFKDFPGFVDRRCHLTKLMKEYEPDQMEDIYLKQAPDDKDFRYIEYYGGGWLGMLGSSAVFAVVLFLRRKRKRRSGP